ncbi:MAG: hypothetical protein KF789_12220 [Bdellovibrionaceae bacterium]|nr:hypothetical protein [Pseudobdellovibrionaceae bacterium]
MKLKTLVFAALALALGTFSVAQETRLTNVQQYNDLLPLWGVSWAPGSNAINGYYPTFYTGFVMRSEFPERIHVRVARGNQTRISVILDETTVSDYTFDLAKRYHFYRRVTEGQSKVLNIAPSGAKFLPQLSFFNQIIESGDYGILPFVTRAEQGAEKQEDIYRKGLELLSSLNPGRVFKLNIDLKAEFNRWRQDIQKRSNGDLAKIMNDPKMVVVAINTLVPGRINYTEKPSAEVLAKLQTAAGLALQNASDDQLLPAAFELFKATTGTKYQIRVLGANGQWQPAVQCSVNSCTLSYPEFTTIYPTGSAEAFTSDEFGNRITSFATPGLWQFLNYAGRDVDNIRNEPYYGFAPKMDFEGIGNGFHNPAVRFYGVGKDAKEAFGIQSSHNTLWAVKRGGVSHGCLRLPLGHVWELRQILPVENSKMTKVMFFGNNSQDFDLYDINGDGKPEVMGVQYMISYGMQGAGGLARREGANLEINADRKADFYRNLYGSKNVFRQEGTQFVFSNPKTSLPSHLDFKKKSVSTRITLAGDYPLYEQSYEKDKVQFYSLGSSMTAQNKLIVRLMGRIKGCAPKSDKTVCGENAFDQEAKGLLR